MGSVSSSAHLGALLAQLLLPAAVISRLGVLLTVALLCWKHCMARTAGIPLHAPAPPLVGRPHCDPLSFFTARQLSTWTYAGLVTTGVCFEQGVPLLFEELVATFGLSPGQFFLNEA